MLQRKRHWDWIHQVPINALNLSRTRATSVEMDISRCFSHRNKLIYWNCSPFLFFVFFRVVWLLTRHLSTTISKTRTHRNWVDCEEVLSTALALKLQFIGLRHPFGTIRFLSSRLHSPSSLVHSPPKVPWFVPPTAPLSPVALNCPCTLPVLP